jgi:hypothetical protein
VLTSVNEKASKVKSKVERSYADVYWFLAAMLVSIAVWFVVNNLVASSQYLVLNDARVTTLYGGVITLLALVISVGSLTYVEFLNYSGRLYNDFVQALSNITTNPDISSLTPRQWREIAEKEGVIIPDTDFLSQSTWSEVARITQFRMKDTTQVIDSLFYGVVFFSGVGIIVTLGFSLVQVYLNWILTSLDFGIAAVVFFGFLLYLFAILRKSSLELLPLMVASGKEANSH